MATRTVRLDDETEAALLEIQGATGMTMSQALKSGLALLRDKLRGQPAGRAWDVYERLDLGPGGYCPVPAREAKRSIGKAIRRNHRG